MLTVVVPDEGNERPEGGGLRGTLVSIFEVKHRHILSENNASHSLKRQVYRFTNNVRFLKIISH